mgnify:FL=1
MKSENKICLLLALLYSLPFLFFGLLLLLFSLPVHAAESNGWSLSSNAGIYKWEFIEIFEDDQTYMTKALMTLDASDQSYFYAFVRLPSDSYTSGFEWRAVRYKIGQDYDISKDQNSLFFTENPMLYEFSYRFGKESTDTQTDSVVRIGDGEGVSLNFNNRKFHSLAVVPFLPCFESFDALRAFCVSGDSSGLLNGGSVDNPDFEDTAYAFTGFTANNKMTATWTGTTDRSYLQDQEVEEYVRVNYYFADKEAQDTIKQADAYPDEFATADKTLTIDVSGLKPDDENWFLRYIRITPCYRQAGLGVWGDFYHGEPSYVYFNQDGSIDKIDSPYIKGELSSDMERPVIVLHEGANGNPTESDYSYFEFNNAQSDYFFEMKGRWYTTNDFDLYRDKLVWKYKYSTLLKNNLSTWVSVSDNRSSVGKFQFDVLGKSSWDNLLSSYPVDDRNYIGGSYDLFNKITGYSDALETLKMLLKQPYSLFNGYEVYVRYFRYDENGGIQYSKWTHFYNNLADSDGSSGSRLDDLDNMYSENQSDKGLTDDELSDLENGGNSRNDLDAVPKNNYDYSSLENATMNFFDLLKNFGTMLGQFPSMVAAVFGFLPPWLIGLIAVAIGAVIVCRFIGR